MRTHSGDASGVWTRFPTIALLLAVVLLALRVGDAQAQTPKDREIPQNEETPTATSAQAFHACYVPPSGVVYLIKAKGLPDHCVSPDHVEFSWSMEALSGSDQFEGPVASAKPGPPPNPGSGDVVVSLNTLVDELTLVGTGGTTVTTDGVHEIQINSFSGDHADLLNVQADQHHAPYTDLAAVVAMGATGNTNPLNHDRYADLEAIAAMGAKDAGNPLNHDRYTDDEARSAVGATFSGSHEDLTDVDPNQHHPRYTDAEAIAAVGVTFSGDHADLTNVLADQHHAPYTDLAAVLAMGTIGDENPFNHNRYTDAEAIAAVGPVLSDHDQLTNVLPDQHHTRYTDAEAIAAVGPVLSDHDQLTNVLPDQHHARYTDAEAIAAVGPTVGDGHSLDAVDGSPTDVLFVNESGRIGIGTTSPSDAMLNIHLPSNDDYALRVVSPDGFHAIDSGLANYGESGWIGLYDPAVQGSGVYLTGRGASTFKGGPVGIGTAYPDPEFELDVRGVIRTTGGIEYPDGTTQATAADNHPRYTDAEAIAAVGPVPDGHSLDSPGGSYVDAVYVSDGGRVGIRNTNPQNTLDVQGPFDVRGFDGSLRFYAGDGGVRVEVVPLSVEAIVYPDGTTQVSAPFWAVSNSGSGYQVAAGTTEFFDANCGPGYFATGGGYTMASLGGMGDPGPDVQILASYRLGEDGWRVKVANRSSATILLNVSVVCARLNDGTGNP